jgi:pyruvate dehydrogenase E2 component (dihydrolipoamide acetyltransferase)
MEAPTSGTLRIVAQPAETRGVTEVIGFILAAGEPMPEAGVVPAPLETIRGKTGKGAPLPPVTAPKAAVREVRSSPAARRLARELGVDIGLVQGSGSGSRITEKDVQAFFDEQKPRQVRSSPAARRLARELGVDIARVPGTGREGRINESDVQRFSDEQSLAAGAAEGRAEATPLARRIAEDEGLDLDQVRGTGPGGRITEDDVLGALDALFPAQTGPGEPGEPGLKTVPFIGMRQAIAEGMMASLHSTAQLTLTTQVDATDLVALRDILRERWGERITYTDLLVKAVALALREHPILNSVLVGEEIALLTRIDIGVAVALDEGLIVPVVREADGKSVQEIHRALQDLARRAREGTLKVDEVTGSTFTITNLGMYGIDAFTPIINPPEAAILGVGRIDDHLVLIDGRVMARSRMTLSLTIDHRIVDGAPGGAFLRTLAQFLEHPALIFAEGPAPSKTEGET